MIIKKSTLQDCYIIEPEIFEDERGYFYEKFNEKKFVEETGFNGHFVQDNISKSYYGVLRGLHLQKGAHAQAKLVSCLEGTVWDVAVDLRKNSTTYGQWFGIELSGDNKLQLYIPRGFAHGFCVLSETAIFAYKCDNYFNKESEGGVYYKDADLLIDWKIPEDQIILSPKDQNLLSMSCSNF